MHDILLDRFNQIERTHWWWEGRRALIKQLLKGSKPKKILDVGCGTGETMNFLQELYPIAQIYGVDTSQKALQYAKSRGHSLVELASASKLPYKADTFDIILILDVIEHIKKDAEAVKELKRVLKRGGKLVITAPAMKLIWSDFDDKQGHVKRYTRTEFRQLAKVSGMKINFISYFNFFLAIPIITIRILSRSKMFSFLAGYDKSFNYDIAFKFWTNRLLKNIFLSEISLLRFITYPFGISIVTLLEKVK